MRSLRRAAATVLVVLGALAAFVFVLTALTWPIRWWHHL